jgi:hypothetical protein
MYRIALKLPNGHKLCMISIMAIEYTNLYTPMPSKIFPNWYFWFENTPSGNPGPTTCIWNMSIVQIPGISSVANEEFERFWRLNNPLDFIVSRLGAEQEENLGGHLSKLNSRTEFIFFYLLHECFHFFRQNKSLKCL